jgi:hypothetical protein
VVLSLLLLSPVCLAGCNLITTMGILFAPRQTVPAQFELTRGRVALVVDCLRPDQDNPVFTRALADKTIELFRANKVAAQIVPQQELVRLRQTYPDFRRWSIQRIGRQLGAEQVLYVAVDTLVFQDRPDNPVVMPYASLRVKVIGTHELSPNERLWPDDEEGCPVVCRRPPVEAISREVVDIEAAKLGRDTAQYVARLFFKWDEENKPIPEP